MNYLKSNYIVLIITLIFSYLVATHYAFQLWSSILVGLAIFVSVCGFNLLLNTLLRGRYETEGPRFLLFVLILVTVIQLPKYKDSDIYQNCEYPPFAIVEDSAIDYMEYFDSRYFESEQFTGYITYHNTMVQFFNEQTKEVGHFSFGYGNAELQHLDYLDGFIYISGWLLDDSPNTYSMWRYDVEQDTLEQLLTSDDYINFGIIGDEIHVSENQESGRNISLYDTDFNLIETLEYNYFIRRVDTYDAYQVVQTISGIDLYENGDYIATLGTYESLKHIHFYQNQIYITADSTTDVYYTDIYDFSGNKVDIEDNYPVDNATSYIMYGDYYVIKNTMMNWDELANFGTGIVDKNDEAVCKTFSIADLRILDSEGIKYGYHDYTLYELEELRYTVPLRYDNPQHGFYYWISIIVIITLMVAPWPYDKKN